MAPSCWANSISTNSRWARRKRRAPTGRSCRRGAATVRMRSLFRAALPAARPRRSLRGFVSVRRRRDTGGSIRQPAAFTGTVGIKPTYGRCSRWGIVAFASSLDQAGPIARNVRDAAIFLRSMAGADPKLDVGGSFPVPDYEAAIGGSIKGKRIGIPKEYRLDGMSDEIEGLWQSGIAWLREAGAEHRRHFAAAHQTRAAGLLYRRRPPRPRRTSRAMTACATACVRRAKTSSRCTRIPAPEGSAARCAAAS